MFFILLDGGKYTKFIIFKDFKTCVHLHGKSLELYTERTNAAICHCVALISEPKARTSTDFQIASRFL